MITTPLSYDVSVTREIGHLPGLSQSGQTPSREDNQSVSQIDLLGYYSREIDRYPLLTEAEEQHLIARIAEGDEQARERLILSNLRLVVSIAKRYQSHYPGHLVLLDLIGYGNVGLIRAVSKYDHTRGTRFVTCATIWVKAAILRALDEQGRLVRLSSYRIVQVRHLLNREDALQCQIERTPSPAELAASSGKRLETVEQLLASHQPSLSLDALFGSGDGDDQTLLSILADEQAPDPAQMVCEEEHASEMSQTVQLLLSCLTPREAQVVILRFGLDGKGERSDLAICQYLRICKARVYQLLHAALKKMRASEHAHVLRRAFLEQRAC
jgi:RNA polymerase primary sigma factor